MERRKHLVWFCGRIVFQGSFLDRIVANKLYLWHLRETKKIFILLFAQDNIDINVDIFVIFGYDHQDATDFLGHSRYPVVLAPLLNLFLGDVDQVTL